MTVAPGDPSEPAGARPPDVVDHPERWPVRSSEDVWRGDAPFAVRLDHVHPPHRPDAPGQPGQRAEPGDGGEPEVLARLIVEHPGAVVVLAVDDDERALVLHQYRHAAGMRFVELPAGLLDVPGEDPEVAARRELLEEGALEATQWTLMSSLWTTPGISQERVHTFLARGLRPRPDRGGFVPVHEEADMSAHWVPMSELVDGVLSGALTDMPLVVAVLWYARQGA